MTQAYTFILDQFKQAWYVAGNWIVFPGLSLLFLFAVLIVFHTVIALFVPKGVTGLGQGMIARGHREKLRKRKRANTRKGG